ncbi:NADH:flavin oxidoreductase (fragment) [Denitratisoma oestradiolicum]|uniref:NADH:flavin oxidoreductase n=2 Tax=Denitratisoma oestradiolicum TaxID=311182 RepID=A0A6S6XYJ7_9PROT
MGRPFMQPTSRLHYKEATEEDLAWVCEQFADATERARKAGIDAVELHAAHGYLISNFLSPSTNHRTDRYGGSLENRARLLVEVIQAIRARVGRDYPVWIRLDGVEFLKNEGITSLDACAAARLAEAAGVDAINVSSYADPNRGVGFSEAHATHIPCKFVPYAAAIKQAVNIPVITAGRIEPEIANELLLEGKVDFINMGRKLLADPDLPNKLMHGRPETIRPCIYCYTCISQIFVGSHVRCAVNATTAFERECAVIATDKPRRVLVVGGGPGGMETARVAALRGHDVTLCEQGSSLGGTVLFSAISYPPNGRLVSYLEQSLRDLPVKVHLNTRADEAWIRRHNPDVVVVATGARRDSLPIQGADLPHVLTGDSMRAMMGAGSGPAPGGLSPLAKVLVGIGRMLGVTRSPKLVEKASHYWLPFGRNIVIYGGGLVGIELAEFLAERGRNVTVLEESGLFGTQLMLVRRWRAFYECDRLGVARIANVKDVVIEPDRVRYVGKGGQERSIPADHIILAAGAEADMSFADSIRKAGFNVKTVGDCQSIGYIEGAIRNGHAVAREI